MVDMPGRGSLGQTTRGGTPLVAGVGQCKIIPKIIYKGNMVVYGLQND